MKGLWVTIVALGCTMASFAQLTLEGQYRPRLEVRNGLKKPIVDGQEPAAFVEHRARFIAGYSSNKIGFKFSIQDVRVWGETGQINKSDVLLSTHEAYGDYYMSSTTTLRIGRQEVIYDGHRLFGSLDWAMQGRSLDAVRFMYKDTLGNQIDFMGAWNQVGYGDGAPEPANLTGSNYVLSSGGGTTRIFNLGLPKAQAMGYYKKTLKSGDVAFMLLDDIYTSTDSVNETHSNYTFGFTPNFKFNDIKVGGQFFYTGGAAGLTYNGSNYENISLSGYMVNAYIQHTGLKAAPLIGVDYISGDDESTPEVEGWEPKYGTNHKFYGFMDYFYVGNGHGGANAQSAGLLDVYLNTTFKFAEKNTILGFVHYFASAEDRTNTTSGESFGGALGTELDLVYVRKLDKGLVFKAGYSQMFGITETMKQLKFGNPDQTISGVQNWTWVMLAYSPKFM